MPDMDGFQLAGHTPNAPRVRHPTADRAELDRQPPPERVRFSAYLTKPVKQSQLYNTLVGLFVGQRVETRPQAPAPMFDASLGRRNPLRILLAEDILVNQKLMLTMLSRMGYKADVGRQRPRGPRRASSGSIMTSS